MSGDYHWAEKKAKIEVKDLSIQIGEAWSAKDNFVSATDIDGQPVAFSELTVEGQQKGQITLHYVDIFGQPITDPVTGFVIDPVTFSGHIGDSADHEIYMLAVPGWVMLKNEVPIGLKYVTTPQSYDVIYERSGVIYIHYLDDQGNELAPENRNEDYVGSFDWTSGTVPSNIRYELAPKSIAGYEVIRVEGDAEKGIMEPFEIKHVTFVYKKVSAVTLHVKDTTIYVGDNWQAANNFVSATDKFGRPIDFKELTITGTVNTAKAGIYEITYAYDGFTAKAFVTVKER